MKPIDLIERYVHEVGRHLPRRSRSDIQLELLSLLEDELEGRAADAGGEADIGLTTSLLREFGPPQEMAREYQPTSYLVGPNLFPIYKLVVTIMLAVFGGLHALMLLLFVLNGGDASEIGGVLWGLITNYWETALFYIGLVTLIFVGIERYGDLPVGEEKSADWDPLSLPPINEPNRINRVEMIAGIVGSLIVVYILTGSGRWMETATFPFIGLIAPAFVAQIPWLIASFGLEIILKIIVAWQGRWQTVTRWLDIGQELFGLYVLYRVFQGPILTLTGFSDGMAHLILGLIMGIVVFETIGKLYRLLSGRTLVDFEALKGRLA